MITSFEGVMGSGKTLTAVALAYQNHVKYGKKILANIHLNFPYTHIDNKFLLENIVGTELDDCITILDEAQQFLDARRSGGKLNIVWGYYVVQTRKRGVDLYACFHHVDVMDKRFRRQIDIRGTCSMDKEEPCLWCKCQSCGGSGVIENIGPCPECDGKGGTGRPLSPTRSTRCIYCGGTGEVDKQPCLHCKGTGEVCCRCLGFRVSGTARTRFHDLRTGRRRNKVTIFAPAIFGLYNTNETIPFTGKQMRIAVEDL